MKKTETYQKRASTTKNIKEKPQRDGQERQTRDIFNSHTLRWANHNLENNYSALVLPQE